MEILTCCIISTRGEIFFLNNFEEESLRLTLATSADARCLGRSGRNAVERIQPSDSW